MNHLRSCGCSLTLDFSVNAPAESWIGECYMHACAPGIGQDFAEAQKWLHKAADQGNYWGAYQLGLLNAANDSDLKQDFGEAYFWMSLALKDAGTSRDALRWQAQFAKSLTAEQRTALDKHVAEWKPTPATAAVPPAGK